MIEQYGRNYNLDIRVPQEYTRLPINNVGEASIIDSAIVKGASDGEVTAHYELSSDHNPIQWNCADDTKKSR